MHLYQEKMSNHRSRQITEIRHVGHIGIQIPRSDFVKNLDGISVRSGVTLIFFNSLFCISAFTHNQKSIICPCNNLKNTICL